MDDDEFNDLQRLLNGWRLVRHRARAKKLRNKGEAIRWSNYLQGWIWRPAWIPEPPQSEGEI